MQFEQGEISFSQVVTTAWMFLARFCLNHSVGMDITTLFGLVRAKYQFKASFELKDHQMKLLQCVLEKKNCFGFLPTGYGKSMSYMLPPLLLDEVCKQ